jgi:plastocyanin
MKKSIVIIMFVLLPGVLSGCGTTTSRSTNTPVVNNPSAGQDSGQTATSTNESASIDIQNFAFNPATLKIKQGTTVVWTNNDSVPHQIKSDAFNSDRLSQGQSFSFTFKTAGRFDYICAIHTTMAGTIIVQ